MIYLETVVESPVQAWPGEKYFVIVPPRWIGRAVMAIVGHDKIENFKVEHGDGDGDAGFIISDKLKPFVGQTLEVALIKPEIKAPACR